MHKGNGFSIVEILIVLVIAGVLVALAFPNYGTTKERSLDREAKATLAILRAAEKIYRMEEGGYYPATSTSSISAINSNLKLSLPSASTNWTYTVNGATTTGTAARGGRTWSVDFTSDADPTCSGSGCP